jgi:sugar phosphate isomerase/epimerase
MFLGYNTNGLAHHDPLAAVELLADIGYRGVALTLDHSLGNPFRDDWPEQADAMLEALERRQMRSVIETGARYLLNPRQKHEPTLVSPGAAQRLVRVEFLLWAIDIAVELGSDCVSLWSGVVRDGADEETVFARLVEGLRPVVQYAGERRMTLAFEPEPGMFIDTMARYAMLLERIDAPHFRLTLDIGHLHCSGETPLADYVRQWGSRIANVHVEDMRAGVHEHLMFGEGEIDFPPVIAALAQSGYQGGLYVELSRHSHAGPAAAQAAYDYLIRLLPQEANVPAADKTPGTEGKAS